MKIAQSRITALAGLAGILLTATSAQAAVVLSTDFENDVFGGTAASTISSMTGVVWTENGITAPTSLAASAVIKGDQSGADAVGGYFSANVNVNGSTSGSPAWTTNWTITVGSNDVTLTDIVLRSAETNSGGLIGGGTGDSDINLNIVDNFTTTSVFNNTQVRSDNTGASQALTYTAPISLVAGRTYQIQFSLWETGSTSNGHFEAFDSLTFNGTVIPEPSAAFLGIVGLGLLVARRRR